MEFEFPTFTEPLQCNRGWVIGKFSVPISNYWRLERSQGDVWMDTGINNSNSLSFGDQVTNVNGQYVHRIRLFQLPEPPKFAPSAEPHPKMRTYSMTCYFDPSPYVDKVRLFCTVPWGMDFTATLQSGALRTYLTDHYEFMYFWGLSRLTVPDPMSSTGEQAILQVQFHHDSMGFEEIWLPGYPPTSGYNWKLRRPNNGDASAIQTVATFFGANENLMVAELERQRIKWQAIFGSATSSWVQQTSPNADQDIVKGRSYFRLCSFPPEVTYGTFMAASGSPPLAPPLLPSWTSQPTYGPFWSPGIREALIQYRIPVTWFQTAIQNQNLTESDLATLPLNDLSACPLITEICYQAGPTPANTLVVPGTDWVEIYNPFPKPVNLCGYYLSDNKNSPLKYPLATADLWLPPNSHWVHSFRPDRHNPNPSNDLADAGEQIYLTNKLPDGTLVAVDKLGISKGIYNKPLAGISYGRYVKTGSIEQIRNGFFHSPTPGSPNLSFGASIGYLQPPTINEITTKPDGSTVVSPLDGRLLENGLGVKISLSHPNPNTKIVYTLNGAEPSLTGSSFYTEPFTVYGTAVIRVRAIAADAIPSGVVTRTLIEPDGLLAKASVWKGQSRYDYFAEKYNTQLRQQLRSHPWVVITDNKKNVNTNVYYPSAWCSYELVDPGRVNGIGVSPLCSRYHPARVPSYQQDNALIATRGESSQGGGNSYPSPQRSYELTFTKSTSLMGKRTLMHPLFGHECHSVMFRNSGIFGLGGSGMYWGQIGEHDVYTDSIRHACISQKIMLDLQRSVGNFAVPPCEFVHVMINGEYWGAYTLIENPDRFFFAENYKRVNTYLQPSEAWMWTEDNMEVINADGDVSQWILYNQAVDRLPQQTFGMTPIDFTSPTGIFKLTATCAVTNLKDWDSQQWKGWHNPLSADNDSFVRFIIWDGDGAIFTNPVAGPGIKYLNLEKQGHPLQYLRTYGEGTPQFAITKFEWINGQRAAGFSDYLFFHSKFVPTLSDQWNLAIGNHFSDEPLISLYADAVCEFPWHCEFGRWQATDVSEDIEQKFEKHLEWMAAFPENHIRGNFNRVQLQALEKGW